MEHYRRTAHARFDIKYYLVGITKYRKPLVRGEVGVRLRQIIRDICAELEVEILKGHISKDHVHMFVSYPPHVSASYLVQRVKGKSSRKLLQEYSHLRRECWGRHVWPEDFLLPARAGQQKLELQSRRADATFEEACGDSGSDWSWNSNHRCLKRESPVPEGSNHFNFGRCLKIIDTLRLLMRKRICFQFGANQN